ncbi:LON peptidase N-terminal domain and RING finger protein 2 [Manis javanica]|nr:LON peptidase N-terminal domain and RING finger protein 2 [Manis javanica]
MGQARALQPRGDEPRAGPGGGCGEPSARRLEKGEEAFRVGDYEMAAELLLAGLAQPDRGRRCVDLGPARPLARRVNVVLSGLLEKCCRPRAGCAGWRARRGVCSVSSSPRPRCSGAAKPWTWGHHVKAQALSGLERSTEVLKEFLHCLALNPECNSVKKEAQKVMCEVSFPASENMHPNLTPSIQSRMSNSRLKAQCHSHINSQPALDEGGSAGSSKNPSEKCDVFRNASSSVFTRVKRQLPSDLEDAPDLNALEKFPRKLLASRNFNTTILAKELIFRYLSDVPSDRKRVYDEEMMELSNLTRDVPIFVCAMAFPTVPCPLHVFEPRYWLMIRRCMETGTKWFGMCLSAEHAGISECGCMLEIKDVRTFPDGGSVVDTIGISQFRVLSHCHRDGYNTVDIQYLEDEKSNASGPTWSWWVLAVLPLERKAQLAILGMTSLRERLLAIWFLEALVLL